MAKNKSMRNKSRKNKTEGGKNKNRKNKTEGGKNKTRKNKTEGDKRKLSNGAQNWMSKVMEIKNTDGCTLKEAMIKASKLKKKGQL